MAGSLVVGSIQARHQQNRAQSKARAAYEAAQTDRALMVRNPIQPRRVIYGENVVSGVMAYVGTHGHAQYNDYLRLVLVLAGHELDSISEIRIDDHVVQGWTGDDWAHDARFCKGLEPDGSESVKAPVAFRQYAETLTVDAATLQATLNYAVDESIPFELVRETGEMVWVPPPGDQGGSYERETVPVPASEYSRDGQVITLRGPALAHARLVARYAAYSDRAVAIGPRASTDPVERFLRVRRFLGHAQQEADMDLVAGMPDDWTPEHRGNGIAYLSCTLKYNQDIYPNGLPQISARVKGAKCFDPRTGERVYTENAALIAADWLCHPYGFRCSHDEIDWATVVAAANICDESVELGEKFGNAEQPRYTCHGVISAEGDRKAALADICAAMSGGAVFIQGRWKIYAGAYRTPVLTLTEDDVTDVAAVNVVSRMPRSELFNAVRGTYQLAPPQSGEAEFPPMLNPLYTEQDGELIYTDLRLPLVNDVVRAQRLAKITLERSRQAIVVNAGFTYKAYGLAPFDTVRLTMPRFGWTDKVFRVAEREFSADAAVQLTLVEEAMEVYAWNGGDATPHDLAPDTSLPSPFMVAAPTGLSVETGDHLAAVQADGSTLYQMRVRWDRSSDLAVVEGGRTELEYRLEGGATPWRLQTAQGGAHEALIEPILTGRNYQVRARFVNSSGVHGSWATASHVAGGRTAFDAVALNLVTQGDIFSIRLDWALPPGRPDIGYSEIYYSRGPDRASATLLGAFAAPQVSHTLVGLGAGEVFYFWVRPVDRSANVGQFFPTGDGVRGMASMDVTKILAYLTAQIDKTQLAQALVREIEDAAETADAAHARADAVMTRADEAAQRAAQASANAQAAIERAGSALARLQVASDDIEVAQLLTSAERFLREEEDVKVDRKIEEVSVELRDRLGARVLEIQEALAAADEAIARRFSLVQARLDDNTAGIATETRARVDALGALSEQTSALIAQSEGRSATAVSEQAARTSAVEASVDTVSGLVAALDASTSARLADTAQAVSTLDAATAQRLQSLGAELADTQADLVTESQARADGVQAVSNQVQSLRADVGRDLNAALVAERGARVDALEAVATDLVSLRTQVSADIGASIAAERSARASAVEAVAQEIEGLRAEVAEDLSAAITAEQQARVSAVAAEARRVNALTASTQALRADLTSEATTRSNQFGSLSSSVTTAQATANTARTRADAANTSAARAETKAEYIDGVLSAAHTLQVQTNFQGKKYLAGIGVGIEQNGANAPLSDITLRADRFSVITGSSGTPVSPFTITGNTAYINNAVIGRGSIETLHIQGDAVMVPISLTHEGDWLGSSDPGLWQNVLGIDVVIPAGVASTIFAFFSAKQHYTNLQAQTFEADILVAGARVQVVGGEDGVDNFVSLCGATSLGTGRHRVQARWRGSSGVALQRPRLLILATKRHT